MILGTVSSSATRLIFFLSHASKCTRAASYRNSSGACNSFPILGVEIADNKGTTNALHESKVTYMDQGPK